MPRMQKNIPLQTNTEETASEVKASFEALIACMPVNVYWMDRDLIYRGCSDNVVKMLGFNSSADIIGKTHDELTNHANWGVAGESFKIDTLEVLHSGRAKLNVEEPPISDKAGNIIYFLTSRVPLRDEQDNIIGVLGVSRDVTEYKKMQDALREAKERAEHFYQEKLQLIAQLNQEIFGKSAKNYQTPEEYTYSIRHYLENIIACMPGNVYWMDTECRYLGCNDNVAKTLGLKLRSNIVGKTYADFAELLQLSCEQVESFRQADFEVLSAGIPKLNVEELPFENAQGSKVYFLTSRVPIRDQQGQVVGVVGISIDITERKKMEQQLLETTERAVASDKAKTAFLENMRHDIRTPLVGITGTANIMKSQAHDPKKIVDYANHLIASSEALLAFLNEILESIRATSGNLPLFKKKFDLKEKLQAIVELNRAKAVQKQLDFLFEYDRAIPRYVLGDPLRIQRIVLELVTNALNFTSQGSVKIAVTVAQKKGRNLTLKISVQDTGIGIPLDQQEAVYTRFKRLNPSCEGIYTSGPGLGLGIVKQFMDDLDGELHLVSAAHEGATFTCLIPIKEPLLDDASGVKADVQIDEPSLPAPVTPIKPLTTKTTGTTKAINPQARILVVEDHALAARIVENMLIELNCQVDIAVNGADALQQAMNQSYDLIFMDIGLPDIDGYAVTQRIRLYEQDKNTRALIIALTAHVDAENQQQCLEAGMDSMVSKPLTKKGAEDILANLLTPDNYVPSL